MRDKAPSAAMDIDVILVFFEYSVLAGAYAGQLHFQRLQCSNIATNDGIALLPVQPDNLTHHGSDEAGKSYPFRTLLRRRF
jgi:hypothetical protein